MRYIFLLTALLGSSLTYNVIQHKRLRERESVKDNPAVRECLPVVASSGKPEVPVFKTATSPIYQADITPKKVEAPPDELASMILSRLRDRTKWERYGKGIREVNGTLEMGWDSFGYRILCNDKRIGSALSDDGWNAVKQEGIAIYNEFEKEEAEQLRREAIGALKK